MNRVRTLAFAAILLMAISAAAPAGAACMDEKFFSSGGSTITHVASDGSSLFAATLNGRITRINAVDGSSQTIATVAGAVESLLADAGTVFYATSRFNDTGTQFRQIYALPAAGGIAVLLGEVPNAVGRMKADAQALYWIVPSSATAPDGSIQKLSRAGGTAQTLAGNLAAPTDLALDSTSLYFTEAGTAGAPPYGLRKISKNGGAVTKLTTDRSARRIAGSDGTNVYFSAKEDDLNDRIYRIPVGGGSAAVFSAPLQSPSRLELSGSKVLYSSSRYDWTYGSIGSAGVIESNGTIVKLFEGPVRSFAADTAAMYAIPGVTNGGSIERICLNYTTAPRIASVSGAGASGGGTLVVITGERFQSGAKVVFDGLEGVVLAVTSTEIQVRTPAHAAGNVSMYVINPDGQSGRSTFYFYQSSTARKRAVHR